MIEKVVGIHEAGQRLDRWLRKAFPQAPLSALFAVVRKKKIRVNGKPGKGPDAVQAGDVITIYENLPTDAEPAAAPINANTGWNRPEPEVDPRVVIVERFPDFVVLDKPSGLASQPGSGQKLGDSLIELLWTWAELEILDFKPALVHRLDQETSGLIIAALSGVGVRGLNTLIREHEVRKEYLALVAGHLKDSQGSIRLALDRTDSAQGAKMEVGAGKEAVTHYKVDRVIGPWTLVRIRLETGRMHQIRAHFAALGHPLLGDGRYGDFAMNREVRKTHGLKRLFLHSALLEFKWNGKVLRFEADLPEELRRVIA